MIGEILGDIVAGLLSPDFSGSKEKRAIRRLTKELAAGRDAVVPGLWLRSEAAALDGYIRVRPPFVWWRPAETSASGELAVCEKPDRVLVRLPHLLEIKQGVPKFWVVLVLTAVESRSVLAIPKYYGRLLTGILAPPPSAPNSMEVQLCGGQRNRRIQ